MLPINISNLQLRQTPVPKVSEGLPAFIQWLRDEANDERLMGRPRKAAKLDFWANELDQRLGSTPPQ